MCPFPTLQVRGCPPPSHGSGSGWFATPFLYDSFIRYFTPVYPDAIQVNYLGQTSIPFPLTSAAAAPALFTYNGSGSGPAAALNQDNSYNAPNNPAARGSYVTLYLTGEGQTSPGGVTGKVTTVSPTPPLTPQPVLHVAVLINGQPASVVFYGEAPGMVSGVMQLDVQIPANVPSGNLPLQVSVGNASSQNAVTISVL